MSKNTNFAAEFEKIVSEIVDEATKELFEIGLTVASRANSLAPVDKGKLKGSFKPKLRHRGVDPVVIVGTSVPHAPYVEFAKKIRGKPYGKNLGPPARVLHKALDQVDVVKLIAGAVERGLGRVEPI